MHSVNRESTGPGSGKRERYIKPSILLGLLSNPAYGYELIQKLPEYGFIEGDAPPGMVYRHLRQMEDEGLLTSHWETEGSGPAKRMYTITADGRDALELWIVYMESQTAKLSSFIDRYRKSPI